MKSTPQLLITRAFLACALLGAPVAALADNIDKANCTYKGVPLYGKVKIVTSYADIKVKVVSAYADLSVKRVDAYADECGEWQIVDSYPDFTIQLVNFHADVAITWVDSYAGMQ